MTSYGAISNNDKRKSRHGQASAAGDDDDPEAMFLGDAFSSSSTTPLLLPPQPSQGGLQRRRKKSIMKGAKQQQKDPQEAALTAKPVLNQVLHHHRRKSSAIPSTATTPQIASDDANNYSQEAEGGGGHNRKPFTYTMLNPRSEAWQARCFKWFITIVILADLIGFIVSTEPDITQDQQVYFHIWEGVTSSIFLLEYIARIVVVTEASKYGKLGSVKGRLQWMMTFDAIIDALATMPFFLELPTGWNLPTLTYLRSFRLLRILKTNGFTEATRATWRVIYYNGEILYVAFLICVGLILFTGCLMYYLRPQGQDAVEDFKSLSSSMYVSTLMLTGQGGPDGTDLPWYTRSVILLTGAFSIGMFAIPASMLTWGFEAEAERCAKRAYARAMTRGTGADVDEDFDTWSFSSDDYSTDEEYRRLIAGVDDGDSEEEDDEETRKAKEDFMKADTDMSGSISLKEFLELSRKHQAEHVAQLSTPVPTGSTGVNIESTDALRRLTSLEKQVQENSQKLDQIYNLLKDLRQSSQ